MTPIKCTHVWFHSMDGKHCVCGSCNVHEIWVEGGAKHYRADECPFCTKQKKAREKQRSTDVVLPKPS